MQTEKRRHYGENHEEHQHLRGARPEQSQKSRLGMEYRKNKRAGVVCKIRLSEFHKGKYFKKEKEKE